MFHFGLLFLVLINYFTDFVECMAATGIPGTSGTPGKTNYFNLTWFYIYSDLF